jgi:hypothetical protein
MEETPEEAVQDKGTSTALVMYKEGELKEKEKEKEKEKGREGKIKRGYLNLNHPESLPRRIRKRHHQATSSPDSGANLEILILSPSVHLPSLLKVKELSP